jgi:sortase A
LCKSDLRVRLVLALVALSTMFAGWICAGQNEGRFPPVGEGCLLYKSPIAGHFEPVPLIHTDRKVDVRGLVASATVTQQHVNSSDAPIEAVYIFPLPHDAAVYDLEIRIGNRRAWEQSLQSGKAEPPWPSADLRPIARLQFPGWATTRSEGATPRSLAFGPRHMLSGARFGGPGNLLLAGHRASWFLPLEQIMQNGVIQMSWFDSRRHAQYERTYRVSLIRVVDATDFAMLAPTSEDALTLVTCYPFGRGAGSPQR